MCAPFSLLIVGSVICPILRGGRPHAMITSSLCGASSLLLSIKKPSPVGEGGSRRLTDEESFFFIVNTSSTAYTVPLPPLGKAIQFYRLFCTPSGVFFFDIRQTKETSGAVAPLKC